MGLTDGTNPYVYVHGSPLHYRDPDGQFAFLAINPYTIALGTAAVGGAICWATNCGAPAVEAATQAQQAYQAPYVLAVSTAVNAVEDMCSEDGDNDKCGSDSRVQALAKAQAFAQVSRKEREEIPFSSLGDDSRGRCFNSLQVNGANNLGYRCSWQNNARVEDHPDGHPHQIGINPANGKPYPLHHNCPHFHATNSKGESAVFPYRRAW